MTASDSQTAARATRTGKPEPGVEWAPESPHGGNQPLKPVRDWRPARIFPPWARRLRSQCLVPAAALVRAKKAGGGAAVVRGVGPGIARSKSKLSVGRWPSYRSFA